MRYTENLELPILEDSDTFVALVTSVNETNEKIDEKLGTLGSLKDDIPAIVENVNNLTEDSNTQAEDIEVLKEKNEVIEKSIPDVVGVEGYKRITIVVNQPTFRYSQYSGFRFNENILEKANLGHNLDIDIIPLSAVLMPHNSTVSGNTLTVSYSQKPNGAEGWILAINYTDGYPNEDKVEGYTKVYETSSLIVELLVKE